MLKEAEVYEKGIIAFRDCVSVVPSLVIDSIEKLTSKEGADYRVSIHGEGSQHLIYLEMKTQGTPKSAREAVNLLLQQIKIETTAYGVFVAPFISPSSATICKEAGIGYIDLSGNCFIVMKHVFISCEKMRNQYPFITRLNSIYSPKSERILRVLLTYPYQPWKVIDLAKEAQVSLGMITHVSKKLIEEEWMTKNSRGISLTRPEDLLADWVNNYTIKRNTLNNYFSLKLLQEIETEIADACGQLNIPYALTGFSACNRLAPMVRGQRAMIYISHDIGRVAERVGLKSVESGANISLIQPYDDGVFWNVKPIGNLLISDPLQVYLDLKRYPGRGEEAADFLYSEVINPRWQQLKMNMIIS